MTPSNNYKKFSLLLWKYKKNRLWSVNRFSSWIFKKQLENQFRVTEVVKLIPSIRVRKNLLFRESIKKESVTPNRFPSSGVEKQLDL